MSHFFASYYFRRVDLDVAAYERAFRRHLQEQGIQFVMGSRQLWIVTYKHAWYALGENGGEVQVTRLNTDHDWGIPYTRRVNESFSEPVSPLTLAYRVLRFIKGEPIDWELELEDDLMWYVILRRRRKALGLNLCELFTMTGYSPVDLSQWERGEKDIPTEARQRLEAALWPDCDEIPFTDLPEMEQAS